MKILLFGASGAMGTAIERACLLGGTDCVPLGHADVDVSDGTAVSGAIARFAPSVVINAVALIGYDICEHDPVEAFRVNSLPASFMARTCHERGITFVQLGTHAVFDGTKDGAYIEDDIPNPLNSYAATKYLAELYCRNLCPQHYIVRLPTLFGPRRNDRPGFVDKMLARIDRGESLRVADDKIDSPTYSCDVAAALLGILRHRLPFGTYHLANAGSVSYFDLVTMIAGALGARADIVPAKDRDFPSAAIKPLGTALASARLAPLRSWQEALREYLLEVKP